MLGRDEFFGDQVEPIAQRRDPGDVGRAVGAHHFLKGQRCGREVNGQPVQRAKVAIDTAHQLFYLLLLGAVDLHAFGCGHGDQQKLDAAQ